MLVHADWVLPVSGPPIRDGAVAIAGGRIESVGAQRSSSGIPLGRVALLPALVNAHTHLELSFLHGLVPPAESFNEWVMAMMALRRSYPDPFAPSIVESARQSVARARAFGTGLVGDVSNTLLTVPLLREAGVAAQVFHELMGFNVPDAGEKVRAARQAVSAVTHETGDSLRVSVAPHAPYSVSAALFKAIRADVDMHPHAVTTVHLGESAAEVELLRYGTGAARTMLETLGVWTDSWRVPGVSPVSYLDQLEFLTARTLVVHGVQFDAADLARLRAIGSTLVSCPRSNLYVGAGSPPLARFYESGVAVAFGTDSLASVGDLDMFAELAEARRIAPRVPAARLLESATLIGARALGFDGELGSIEAGKRADLLAVRVPEGVSDVEEYLVGGIDSEAVEWLTE